MDKKQFNIGLSVKERSNKVIRGIFQNETGVLFNMQLLDGEHAYNYTGFSQVVIEVLMPDGETVYADGLKFSDSINPEDGMVCFNLPIAYTSSVGMHYMVVRIYGGGHMMTSARLNYYVDESQEDYENFLREQDEEIGGRYTALQQALALTDTYSLQEQNREIAEEARRAAEDERVSATKGVLAKAIEYYDQMNVLLARAEEYKRMIEELIDQIGVEPVELSDVVTHSEINPYMCGTYSSPGKILRIKRGQQSDLPSLADGEMGYSWDMNRLYIGTPNGNAWVNPEPEAPYVISATAPQDTRKLWIDSTANNAIKVYDSEEHEWMTTQSGTAVFA